MVGVTNTVEMLKSNGQLEDTTKNIHKYKLQIIYFRNYTGTPTDLLAQFLQIP